MFRSGNLSKSSSGLGCYSLIENEGIYLHEYIFYLPNISRWRNLCLWTELRWYGILHLIIGTFLLSFKFILLGDLGLQREDGYFEHPQQLIKPKNSKIKQIAQGGYHSAYLTECGKYIFNFSNFNFFFSFRLIARWNLCLGSRLLF